MGNLKQNDKVFVLSHNQNGVIQSQVIDQSGGKMELYRVRLESGLYITSLGRNLTKE